MRVDYNIKISRNLTINAMYLKAKGLPDEEIAKRLNTYAEKIRLIFSTIQL